MEKKIRVNKKREAHYEKTNSSCYLQRGCTAETSLRAWQCQSEVVLSLSLLPPLCQCPRALCVLPKICYYTVGRGKIHINIKEGMTGNASVQSDRGQSRVG